MKILVSQLSPKTGDLQYNFRNIAKYYLQHEHRADICIIPELSTSGYFVEDLLLKKYFLLELERYCNELISITNDTCLLISIPRLYKDILYNSVIVAQKGKIIGCTDKTMLPNSGIFDELRYFAPGKSQIVTANGLKIGVPICEDIWSSDVCNTLCSQGAELLLVPNASPFEYNKFQQRVKCVTERFNETKIPMIYCNQATAHDGIIFDGLSFCFDGRLQLVGKAFTTDNQIVTLNQNKFYCENTYDHNLHQETMIYDAMILGICEYVRSNNFTTVIIGLSGGIDSALVAALAVDALGPENVSAYLLPSHVTSDHSIEDAYQIAQNLNIEISNIAIHETLDGLVNTLMIEVDSIAYQNLQSRIRGVILMAEANKRNSLLLTTGNKSEYATGYATLYGDMNGAFNPIKDIYKTKLYQIAQYRNTRSNIFPTRVLTKEPTAELSPNQKDSDTLPKYVILDQILERYIEQEQSADEISQDFDKKIVQHVIKLVNMAEFKRQQSAPGVKISSKHFDKERRYPITNQYLA